MLQQNDRSMAVRLSRRVAGLTTDSEYDDISPREVNLRVIHQSNRRLGVDQGQGSSDVSTDLGNTKTNAHTVHTKSIIYHLCGVSGWALE
jgi:hypothetical protein